jgi:hypothetical protein
MADGRGNSFGPAATYAAFIQLQRSTAVNFRSILLGLAAAAGCYFACSLARADYGHWEYGWPPYPSYPCYGADYHNIHHHHYVYRPHNWHWHPAGWGPYGPIGGWYEGNNGSCGGPVVVSTQESAPPRDRYYDQQPGTNNRRTDDVPELPELPELP